MARSNETDAWIQEILRLRGLKDFEMPALVPKHTQYLHEQHLQCTSKVLPMLQSRLLQSNYEVPPDSLQRSPNISQAGGSFPFLKLPPEARALVYRHALLPANKRVHPYVELWFDVALATRFLSSQPAGQSGKKPKIFSMETVSSLLLMQA